LVDRLLKPKTQGNLAVGSLLLRGDLIGQGLKTPLSGIIHQVTQDQILLRKIIPYRTSREVLEVVKHKSILEQGKPLFQLIDQKLKTEDIVQGLPKIEQLFEVRKTKNLEPIHDNPHELLATFYQAYKEEFKREFDKKKKYMTVKNSEKEKEKQTLQKAVRKSLVDIQHYLVDGIQKVYKSQGVDILDKHIEVIIKRMTTKLLITYGNPSDSNPTNYFYGDFVELESLFLLNDKLGNDNKISYEPAILGITQAAVKSESFLSSISFQDTIRGLTRASIQAEVDTIQGFKENIILGQLIPAGTAFKHPSDEKQNLDGVFSRVSAAIIGESFTSGLEDFPGFGALELL
jgi:DNA-directed RNA polymerase subunit beta'